MASTLSDLKKEAAQLPEHERAELALSLIEFLDGPTDPNVEEAWAQEIERRVRELEKGEAESVAAEEVFARIRRRLG